MTNWKKLNHAVCLVAIVLLLMALPAVAADRIRDFVTVRGAQLVECSRRLAELRDEVAAFLSQAAEDHVYWVERTGKAHRTIALNAVE